MPQVKNRAVNINTAITTPLQRSIMIMAFKVISFHFKLLFKYQLLLYQSFYSSDGQFYMSTWLAYSPQLFNKT